MKLDPSSTALYVLSAICLVLVGAILTAGPLSIAERGSVLAAIAAVLFAVGWRIRRDPPGS